PLIQALPTDDTARHSELGGFHAMVDRFRTMPKATIVVLEGIARGGGSELALSFDMRFAAIGRAILAQPEVAVGIIPGGSGTQRLHRLVGRARALEIVLGCDDIDAETAAKWSSAVSRPNDDDAARTARSVTAPARSTKMVQWDGNDCSLRTMWLRASTRLDFSTSCETSLAIASCSRSSRNR